MSSERESSVQKVRGLYVIIDPNHTAGRDPLKVAQAALEGGATAIQFRDKNNDKESQLATVQQLVKLCKDHDAVCVVNDHADLAVACNAHGLHLGQHDLPITEARKIVQPWQFIGKSNALLEESLESYRQGADYIAVGDIFGSTSKKITRSAGIQTFQRIREAIPTGGPPIIAIGGINIANVTEVVRAGTDGICVISAVCQANDPKKAARDLLIRIQAARAKV